MINNLGGLIITFNPEIDRLKENIASITKQLDYIIIVDNNSNNILEIRQLIQNLSVILITNDSNLGIAAALNIGICRAKKDNKDWVVTLDQDSVLPLNTVKDVNNEINNDNANKSEISVGIYAVRFIDEGWSAVQIAKEKKENSMDRRDMEFVITSGNFVNIDAWESVGKFDEDLYIDWVDFDFDKRLIIAGYKIIQLNKVQMRHRIGNSNKPRFSPTRLGFKKGVFVSDHSSIRQYFYFRNKVIFRRRYETNSRDKILRILSIIYETRRVLLYPGIVKKGLSAFRGIKDGLFYKI